MTTIENQPEVQVLLGMAEVAIGVTSIGGASIAAKGAKRLATQLASHPTPEQAEKDLNWMQRLRKESEELNDKGFQKLQAFYSEIKPYAPLALVGIGNPGLALGLAGSYFADYLAERFDLNINACSPLDMGAASFLLGASPFGAPLALGTFAMLPECEVNLDKVNQTLIDTTTDLLTGAAGIMISGGLASMGAKAVAKAARAVAEPQEEGWKDYLIPVAPILSFF